MSARAVSPSAQVFDAQALVAENFGDGVGDEPVVFDVKDGEVHVWYIAARSVFEN